MENSPTPSSPERGSLGAGDLASKYTRLASEYSKVRAQLNVLKKAVIEEKTNKETLGEALKEHETKMRKMEAEMDALNFRNAQLTRRVEFLQQESESSKHGKADKKSKNEITNDINTVMSEELASKIAENAKLHANLDEIDKKYEEKISHLRSTIQTLEHQLSKSAQKDRAEDTKQKELIQGLKFDNVDLVSKVNELEKELVDANDKITVLKVQLESSNQSVLPLMVSSKLKPQIQMHQQIPLNTTEARIQTVEILSTLGESVQNFVAAMSDVHTYWEHRIKDLKQGIKLTDQSSQLSQLLLQNVKFLRPIEQSFQEVLSNVLSNPKGKFGFQLVNEFSSFASNLKSYTNYAVQDIEPLMIACLQQESNSSSCPPTQQAKNSQLITALKSYGKTLKSLSEQIEELAKSKDNNEALEHIENITVSISQLNQQASEWNTIFHSKANDEHQLPTVSEALKDTNTCIISALSSLSQGTSLLSHHLSDNLPKIGRLITSELIEEPIIETPDLEINNVVEEAHEDTIVNDDEMIEKVKKLEFVIDGLNEKLKKSEQSKEHWRLECQLVQLKLGKIQDQDANAEDQDLLPEHLKVKMDELVAAKLLADSKATHFYLECVALQKRIGFWEKAKKKAQENLSSAQNDIKDLKEEVKTTSSNYEEQLSLMSEHLANMNDKLTQQTDEIERLKFELNNKNSGKKS